MTPRKGLFGHDYGMRCWCGRRRAKPEERETEMGKGCVSKHRYSEVEAKAMANDLQNKGGSHKQGHHYLCRFCGFFHIGHSTHAQYQ